MRYRGWACPGVGVGVIVSFKVVGEVFSEEKTFEQRPEGRMEWAERISQAERTASCKCPRAEERCIHRGGWSRANKRGSGHRSCKASWATVMI